MAQEEKEELLLGYPKGRLSISSKYGNPLMTYVTDTETGERLRRVKAIDIHIEAGKETTVTLTMLPPHLELEGLGITEYREYLLDALEKDRLEWERTHPNGVEPEEENSHGKIIRR